MITAPTPVRGRVSPRTVMAALERVPDPEIPAVSIVDLGMVHAIDVEPDRIRVELLPTFVGCPAIDLIRASVSEGLAHLANRIDVEISFDTPWTSDRISVEGRERLRRSGFAPPPWLAGTAQGKRALPMLGIAGGLEVNAVECPYCGSAETTLESVFGPTQCRSIRHCAACRQPFEAFKLI